MNTSIALPMILTHGRPERVHTYTALRKAGYTGPLCILVDNEDKQLEGYKAKFGESVFVFDKTEWAEKTDAGDNFPHRKAIVYARNAAFAVSKELGYKYFIQLDDDYTAFRYRFDRYLRFTSGEPIKRLDLILPHLLRLYVSSGATAMSIAQGGDFIGGEDNWHIKTNWGLKRKCMNFWFCDSERPFPFMGHMNEDCTAYVLHGLRGGLFFHVPLLELTQKATQQTAGGMTDVYKENGTYVKSFYTVLAAPSCTKIDTVAPHSLRIHHQIRWNNACPKILREEWKK